MIYPDQKKTSSYRPLSPTVSLPLTLFVHSTTLFSLSRLQSPDCQIDSSPTFTTSPFTHSKLKRQSSSSPPPSKQQHLFRYLTMPTLTYPSPTATAAAGISLTLSSSNPKTPCKPLQLSLSKSSLSSSSHFTNKILNLSKNKPKTLSPLRSSSTSPSDLYSPIDPTAIATTTALSKTLKSRLQNGETLYGLFLLSFSPTLAEIVGLSGYDYVVLDMEHGPGGIPEALDCLRALAATQTPAIIRLPEACPAWAKKALDLGPQGIMFPMIESSKDAQKAVSYCRFPPEGIRGSAHTVVRASSYGIDEGYLSSYAEELLIMCQVESEEGVKKAKEIAAVDGVDCVQMGPLDLSADLGYLWDPGHKKVREMLRKAERGVLESNQAYLCGFAMPHDPPTELKSRGYHMVAGAVDVGLFRSAAVEDVRRFKMSLMEGDDDDYDDVREEGKDADDKYWSE